MGPTALPASYGTQSRERRIADHRLQFCFRKLGLPSSWFRELKFSLSRKQYLCVCLTLAKLKHKLRPTFLTSRSLLVPHLSGPLSPPSAPTTPIHHCIVHLPLHPADLRRDSQTQELCKDPILRTTREQVESVLHKLASDSMASNENL